MSEPITLSTFPKPLSAPPAGPTLNGDPCTLIIFGAVGDLARRKLMPAVYYLAKKQLLAKDFRIVGVGIEPLDDAKYREAMRAALSTAEEVKDFDEKVFAELAPHLSWVGGNLTEPAVYTALKGALESIERGDVTANAAKKEEQNRLFYLAVPPPIFATIVQHLAESGVCPKMADPAARPWRRAIIEKPFGHDLASAKALSKVVLGSLAEHQIYRIDHYVGKETVQNVLVLRSANAIFEALWSREHITHVEITAAETVGVEERAKYYESSGCVRDMFQNHLLQLLALIAMDPPANPSADAVRDEKVKVLRAIAPLVREGKTDAVRAQYTKGEIKGGAVPGYREEAGVSPISETCTYAALRVAVETPRWRGVPFYLRSGKRLKKRWSEVALHFRAPNKLMYDPVPTETLAPNVLCLRIQPEDGVSLSFEVKVPGAALALTPGIEVQEVKMDFNYSDAFGTEAHPAYETLLLDCMIGDATLFTRTDEVEAAWAVIDPLLSFWACGNGSQGTGLASYPAGSSGPREADELLGRDGFRWRPL
jgi:glucose-6-phosphate 1-dehydrogenase